MSKQLFEAIDQHDAARVAMLLESGADPNAIKEGWQGLRPLHAAIFELEYGGGLDVVALLLERGADVNGWNTGGGVNPLLAAVTENQRAAVELLLKAGADPNVVDDEGDSALRCCAIAGYAEVASLLLAAGAVKTIDEWGGVSGDTALGLAAARLDLPMIRMLLDAGADPEAWDDYGWPARDHLPSHEDCDPVAREEAFELLRWVPTSTRGK
jgi:uncharacterized protein